MAQRVAVLLAVASILVIACAAEGPSMQPAATQKYDKKSHNKHENYDKPDKHDKDYMPDGYMPDGYKPDGYKPEGYRPEGYKPDGYKPDGYKPDGYKHKHPKYSKGEYKERYGNSGYNGYDNENNYGYEGYGYTPDGTPESTPYLYDGGYYGGSGGGLHTIRLDVLLPENLRNTTGLPADDNTVSPPCTGLQPNGCDVDYGLICGLRKSDPYGSYVPYKSYEEKMAPVIQSVIKPQLIGRGFASGYLNWETLAGSSLFQGSPSDLNIEQQGLVIVNGNQKAYVVGKLSGGMVFTDGAEDCHPTLLNDDTTVEFTDMPVYVMFAKIALPADPSAYLALATPTQTVRTMSADSSPSSSKASGGDNTASTLCGLALVARGRVKLTTKDGTTSVTYSGNMEYVKSWTDGLTTIPRLDEEDEARRSGGGASVLDSYLKRLDAVCKTNDIPFASVGSLRLDVVRDRPVV